MAVSANQPRIVAVFFMAGIAMYIGTSVSHIIHNRASLFRVFCRVARSAIPLGLGLDILAKVTGGAYTLMTVGMIFVGKCDIRPCGSCKHDLIVGFRNNALAAGQIVDIILIRTSGHTDNNKSQN